LTSDSRIVSALLSIVVSWLIFASSATAYLISQGASPKLALPFRLLCHGLARRSLRLWDTPMPICARCFGIYLGMSLGILIFLAFGLWLRKASPVWIALASAPLIIDGGTQLLALRESTNQLRLATGLLAGAAFILWALIHIELNGRQNLNRLKFKGLTPIEDS